MSQLCYFDYAATTPVRGEVIAAMTAALEQFGNPSSRYPYGAQAAKRVKEDRATVAQALGCAPDEVFFTSCGTESDNQAVFGYGRRGNVVTTEGEHSAVISSVTELKNRGTAEARFAPLLPDGRVNVEKLLALVDEKTSLVSVMHVNNETGGINDINAIARAIKEKNPRAVFHSDGVQAYGKIPFRLSGDIDLYSVSAHKIGGLKGTGALIRRKRLPPRVFVYGGGQENGERSGTENVFGIKVFEFAAEKKFRTLRVDFERLQACREELWSLLDKDIFLRISSEASSPYILSVSAVGLRGEILLHKANDEGLIIGTGSACSSNAKHRYSRVVLACGYKEAVADGVLRLSFSGETSAEELREAAAILNRAAKGAKEKMNAVGRR